MTDNQEGPDQFLDTLLALANLTATGLIMARANTPEIDAETIRTKCILVLNELDADGPDECPILEWLLPWGIRENALWSIWEGTPKEDTACSIAAVAAVSNAPLIVIVTEPKFFADWLVALGPNTRGVHCVGEGADT